MDFREVPIPLHDHLGLQIDVGPPTRVTMPLGEQVRGAVAPIHGGVVATLVDVACAAALDHSSYDPTVAVPVSTDLSVKFFRQPQESPLVAEATVVHRGSRLMVAECVITDALGRQVARGSGTYMVVTGFGSLSGQG